MLISYSKRETRNLGNYESISVEIRIEDEANLEIETSQQCLMRLKTFVTKNLNHEVEISKDNGSTVKQQILDLLNQDENNKIIIKSILAGFGANKVSDLNEQDLLELSKKLNHLRGNYE